MVLTFNDGSKAILTATDIYLGEMVNSLSIYGNDAVLKCNFTPNNLLNVYFSDEQGIESELIMEKSDHNIGHQSALVADDFLRGYFSEIQDFMECIYYDRQPRLWTYADDIACYNALVMRGSVNVEPLITSRIDWQDATEAYEGLLSWNKGALAVIIHWCE